MGGEVVDGELGDDGWSFGVRDAGGAIDRGLIGGSERVWEGIMRDTRIPGY